MQKSPAVNQTAGLFKQLNATKGRYKTSSLGDANTVHHELPSAHCADSLKHPANAAPMPSISQFAPSDYWQFQVQTLEEQIEAMQEESLVA